MKQDYEVDFFFVSDEIDPVPLSNVVTGYREQAVNTDLHQVFLDMTENYEGKSLQGVLLFSDGADLTQDPSGISPEFAETLTRLNGPVHTFQAGGNQGFKDLAIEKVDATDFGFIYQPLSIAVTVSARAIGKKNIPLVLKEGDKILGFKNRFTEGRRFAIHSGASVHTRVSRQAHLHAFGSRVCGRGGRGQQPLEF